MNNVIACRTDQPVIHRKPDAVGSRCADIQMRNTSRIGIAQSSEKCSRSRFIRVAVGFARDPVHLTGGNIRGENAAALIGDVALHLIPMVNPDGVDLVTGALDSGYFFDGAAAIAADYPGIPFPD